MKKIYGRTVVSGLALAFADLRSCVGERHSGDVLRGRLRHDKQCE